MYTEICKDFKLESKVSPDLLTRYEGILPEDILVIWKDYGFGTIMGGYLKLINPEDYVELLKESYYAADRAVPIMMTAFGDLIVWEDNKYIMMIKYNVGDLKCLASKLPIFWRKMSDNAFLDDYFELAQYAKAIDKFGEPAFDECFGYTPLLGLGGSKKIANLQKVNARVHIDLITQAVGKIE